MPTLVSRYETYRKCDPSTGEDLCNQQKGSDTVITVVDGTKVAMRYWEGLASQKWECAEKDGWLGFVNRASTTHDRGAYLGRDDYENLICLVPHHREWEHFQVVLHDEGFAFEIRKGDGFAFVGITGGGTGLKMSTKGTTWWGFTVIDGATSSQLSDAPSARSLSVEAPQVKLVLHW